MTVADARGFVIGKVVDAMNGLVIRQFGSDNVLIQANPTGILQSMVSFAHSTANCSGQRYLPNMNGAGLVFYGMVSGSTVVYTRLVDPSYNVSLPTRAIETFAPGQSLSAPGSCSPLPSPYNQSMGAAVIVDDADLAGVVAPLKLQ